MTPRERAQVTRQAQGLPAAVEDPAVLARVARLVNLAVDKAEESRSQARDAA